MTKIKENVKFVVCNHEELKKKGWKLIASIDYIHDDFGSDGIITWNMIEDYKGETLTVSGTLSSHHRWYFVKTNNYLWPVEVFLETDTEFFHTCEEGMTPIDGWFICKTCGDNLREIK